MQGLKEFTDLSAREKEIEFESTIQGEKVKGTFVVKFPSIRDRVAIGTKMSQLLADASLSTLPNESYFLAESIAFLDNLIVKKPDWFDYDKIDNPETVLGLYEEVNKFINSFRPANEDAKSKGVGDKSMDKESVESK